MPKVLITGTSSGFGLVTTVELARRGWTVIATMRDLAKRSELDRALQSAGLADHVTVARLDVTEPQSMDLLLTELDIEKRGLDAVVHNAGVAVGGAFEDLDEASIRRVMEVNYFGVLALTKRLLPIFRAQAHGRIVIISSESAFAGQPANSPYCGSKWAVEGWAESIAYEVRHFGIDIILIEPGAYPTNIWDNSPRIAPRDSPYLPLVRHLNVAVEAYVAKIARDPAEVGATVAKALAARHPHFRYAVGPTAKFNHFARGKLPSSVVRKLIGRFLGLNRLPW